MVAAKTCHPLRFCICFPLRRVPLAGPECPERPVRRDRGSRSPYDAALFPMPLHPQRAGL
ncbi:hypothetical protein GCM10027440_46990 [Nocardiopsis coralliicola]